MLLNPQQIKGSITVDILNKLVQLNHYGVDYFQ